MKPVASGCSNTADGLRNDDAERLQASSSVEIDYQDVNPYAFEPAVAPHLAAHAVGVTIDLDKIHTHYQRLCAKADWVVVEGVGGWLVPLNDEATIADLARILGLPIILVVAIRLGCLNHALLTVEAIKQAGLPLAGWIANRLADHGELVKENIAPLDAHRRAVVGRFALPIVRRSGPLEGSHVSAAKHVIGAPIAVSHKRNNLVAALETM